MAVEIKIPSVGESVMEVVIGQWLKKDGEFVEKDEAIAELETDKTNVELSAPESGTLKTAAKEGDTLRVGDVAGSIEAGEGRQSAEPADSARPKLQKAQPGTLEPPQQAEKEEEGETEGGVKASSVAKKVAAELGVKLDQVEGRGIGGRITREDVIAHAEGSKGKPAAPPAASVVLPSAPVATNPKPDSSERAVSRERMTTLRKKIASRLVEAQHTAAILTTFNEVDMTAAMETRTKYKEAFQKKHGVGLGFMSFFVKAAVEALRQYPRINAYIENDEVVYHHYNDIGVAVGTEKGLVVPVVRNAEKLSFAGIEGAIRGFAEKAKMGKLTVDDLTGGTFTISNGGVYGSMMSTPILNPPQSGILGMHNIIKRPIALNDQVVIRPMMYIALSYDHRIVDGREAVGFLIRIKECIESPERMLLEI